MSNQDERTGRTLPDLVSFGSAPDNPSTLQEDPPCRDLCCLSTGLSEESLRCRTTSCSIPSPRRHPRPLPPSFLTTSQSPSSDVRSGRDIPGPKTRRGDVRRSSRRRQGCGDPRVSGLSELRVPYTGRPLFLYEGPLGTVRYRDTVISSPLTTNPHSGTSYLPSLVHVRLLEV